MKYAYIHSPTDRNLICVETHEIVYVDYPTPLEIISVPNIVQDREREAIERYEKTLEEKRAKMNFKENNENGKKINTIRMVEAKK